MDVIFNNGVFKVDETVEDIKLLSWRWSLARLKIPCVCIMSGDGIRNSALGGSDCQVAALVQG